MKKTLKIMALGFILLILFSTICMATDVTSIEAETNTNNSQDSNLNLAEIQNTNNDIFVGNDEISLVGYVNGNAFVAGKKATISGYVNGDLFVMANSLIIENGAQINGNVFALSQEMTISGKVNDVFAIAQTFTLADTGLIIRNLNLSCNNATLNGTIGRDVNLYVETLTFNETAKKIIGQNLNYSSNNEAVIPDGAVVGEINFSQVAAEEKTTSQIILNYVTTFINVILYAIIVIILSAFITPNFATKATYTMSKKPFVTAAIGIGSLVIVPVLSMFLLVTGFLTYVGIALLAIYVLILSITISILGMAIGNYFVNKLKNKTKTKFILLSVVSVAILWLLQKVPYVGGYISIFTVVFGLGIFVYSLFAKKALEESK